MTAKGLYLDRVALLIDAWARQTNTGCRLNGDRYPHVLARRHPAQNTACMIGFKPVRIQGITMLRALLLDGCKTSADLDPLDGIKPHHGMGNVGIKPIINGRPKPCGHPLGDDLESRTDRIPLFA